MLDIADEIDVAEGWVERSEMWISEAAKFQPKRKRRERNSQPLILCGHGISMRVENDALVIRDGFTHYPQTQGVHRYFRGGRDIPTRILLLDGSGTLSFDVLSWLGEQGVALARVKWTGEVAIAASGSGYASDPTKVKWQHDTRSDQASRFTFAAELIIKKLRAGIETLEAHIPPSPKRHNVVSWHQQAIVRLECETFADINDIRAIEAQCASQYFAAWQAVAINWKGQRAVPDEWRGYTSRSSLANGMKEQNRCASHPINAMLNYAYAIKTAQLQIQAIADGYDPTVGIFHHGRRGKAAFIFDLIEPERPKIDAAILSFVQQRKFAAADFVIRSDGACRLSPQLARLVATLIVQP